MKLSDAFKEIKEASALKDLPESISLDLTVKVYNINKEAAEVAEKDVNL